MTPFIPPSHCEEFDAVPLDLGLSDVGAYEAEVWKQGEARGESTDSTGPEDSKDNKDKDSASGRSAARSSLPNDPTEATPLPRSGGLAAASPTPQRANPHAHRPLMNEKPRVERLGIALSVHSIALSAHSIALVYSIALSVHSIALSVHRTPTATRTAYVRVEPY
eukprot:4289667-Pyramimonas_sp.AAC.2